MSPKRLRIFAGPNGSGKSTITDIVRKAGIKLGVYINADELKKEINSCGQFDFAVYLPNFAEQDFWNYFSASSIYEQADGDNVRAHSKFTGSVIHFNLPVNDYFTSFLSDYLRENLLDTCEKFTFETVMSHPSKLTFIQKAKEKGFRVYLYFVALESPLLNKERVASRASQGGHDVPGQKIVDRYERCMQLLPEIIQLADRAYFFDNSSSTPKIIATLTEGELTFEEGLDYMPGWFKRYVINPIEKEQK